jgi:hypothetical protein
MFYTYILQSTSETSQFYRGHTTDLKQRLIDCHLTAPVPEWHSGGRGFEPRLHHPARVKHRRFPPGRPSCSVIAAACNHAMTAP